MKVYVIKRNDGSYYRRHFDNYVQFDNDLMCAEMCSIKESAEDTIDFIARNKYKFNILREELSVVEVQLMETSELADYTKQVRKEVCEEIRNNIDNYAEIVLSDYEKESIEYSNYDGIFNMVLEIVCEIQGEPNET